MALLPAAILALIQGWDRVSRDVADVRDLLIQTAKATASDAETLLASEEQILRALSNLPEVRERRADLRPGARQCAQGPVLFHEYRARQCAMAKSSARRCRREGTTDVSTRPWWPNADQRMGFFVTPQIYSNIAKRNVLAGVLPLQNNMRRFDGVMVVTLDVGWLDSMMASKRPSRRGGRGHFRLGGHVDRVER